VDYCCIALHKNASVDATWEILAAEGFELLYSEELPDGAKNIYALVSARFPLAEMPNSFEAVRDCHMVHFDQIDWRSQWGMLAEEETLSIDLREYCVPKNGELKNTFSMFPGVGFGDLSHPTTRQVLQMMAPFVEGKFVVDLGCGSGILSLAAAKLGARGVCGIDIDSAAIAHAKANARLNALDEVITFQLPHAPLLLPEKTPLLLAMNMVYNEQEAAWNSQPLLHSLPLICMTAGVLKSQRDLYLEQCSLRGWQLVDTLCDGKWCAFQFCT